LDPLAVRIWLISQGAGRAAPRLGGFRIGRRDRLRDRAHTGDTLDLAGGDLRAWGDDKTPVSVLVGVFDVRSFYTDLIATIRSKDTNTPILIGPGGGYSMKNIGKAFLPDPGGMNPNKLIYTASMLSEEAIHRDDLKAFTDFRLARTCRCSCSRSASTSRS
jgi:hypothetical protein